MATLINGNYELTIYAVNEMLSSIPPYALYHSDFHIFSNDSAKDLFIDMFVNSEITVSKRANTAWLFAVVFSKHIANSMPLGIQIELYFCDNLTGVRVSPFVCAYYLMFLCYHGLCDYKNRNSALRQLLEAVNNKEQCGYYARHSFNIAGHCLLVTSDINEARNVFQESYKCIEGIKMFEKYNSAVWYLQNIIP